MIFRPELAEAVMAGRKTVTRRLPSDNPRSPWYRGGCAFLVGRTYAVQPGRGKGAIGRIRVIGVNLIPFYLLDDADARREGFADLDAFVDAWHQIHPGGFASGHLVWRVEFEVVE